jgi:hypothetical protein
MAFLDTLKLCFDNNLILGYCPDKLTLDKVAEKIQKEAENSETDSFGFFDSNQANYNTYYPDVTAEDLAPKEDEFIKPVFRALSEVIVHKEYNPVDFGMNNALKKSTHLLRGASVNVDHETAVANAVGAVSQVSWQEAYKDGNILVPAGINSKLRIDGKSNPKLARNILMDPPAVHSTSVTVQFLWDKSHDMASDEFFSKLGSFDKDGKMVRRIASEIKRYHEISLVGHGADPYAQLIKDAKIVNPTWGNISYNSVTGSQKQQQRYFFFDYKTDVIKNSIPNETNNNNSTNLQTTKMDKEFLIALAAVFGLKLPNTETPGEIETNMVQQYASQLVNTNNTNIQALKDKEVEITNLKAIETKYNTESATFKEAVELKEFKVAETKKLRENVLRNYKLILGEGKDITNDPIIGLINNEKTSPETLAALNSQYTTQLDEKFPLSCKKCGSHEVNRASAKQKDPKEEGNGETGSGNFEDNLRKKVTAKNKTIKMWEQPTE